LPPVTRQPCQVTLLPDSAANADLEAAYSARGAEVAICDGRRALAVEAFDTQQSILRPPARPWWRRLMGD
jgi:hypothetical protein